VAGCLHSILQGAFCKNRKTRSILMIGLIVSYAYVIEAKRANKINYIVLGYPAMQVVNTTAKGFVLPGTMVASGM
jgi:hypothetical protein